VDAATYVALTSVGTRPYVCVEMNYFAYGSNLNTDHLRSWLTRWGVDPEELGPPRKANLPGYRLRTNYLRSNGIGACNIEPRPRSRVEGIVMTVTPSIREVLRLKEGHPHRYAEIEIVVTPFGKQRTVRAFTYIVTHQFALHFDVPVTQEYRRLILEGAASHRLSPPYQKHLRRILRTLCHERSSSDDAMTRISTRGTFCDLTLG
jgi:hypothetical protein